MLVWVCFRPREEIDCTSVLLMFYCDGSVEISFNTIILAVHDLPCSTNFTDHLNLHAATNIHRSSSNCYLRSFQSNNTMGQDSEDLYPSKEPLVIRMHQ